MNIIVTGGAGFIGVNLIKRLVKEGHNVTSIDNYYTGKEENHVEGAKYLKYDIRHTYDYNWVFSKKPDVIFHLAAIARIQPSFKQPKEYFTTNTNGTLVITPNGGGNVDINTDTINFTAGNDESASIRMAADNEDDDGDLWVLTNNYSDNNFRISNDISGS